MFSTQKTFSIFHGTCHSLPETKVCILCFAFLALCHKQPIQEVILEHTILRIVIAGLIEIGGYVDKHVQFKPKWFRCNLA